MPSPTDLTTPWRILLGVLAAAGGVAIGVVLLRMIGPAILYVVGDDSGPFWLTVRVAVAATAIAGIAGVLVGYLLAKRSFRGRDLIEAIGSVPIILPPTVLGYYLLQTLGDGAIGRELSRLIGRPILFTPTACAIAASIAAFPFCMRFARAAIQGVDPRLEQAARTIGLAEWRVALQVTLPLARRGIAAGVTLGGMRAIGEYGATLMVGGDIPGRTRTMSLAVADARTTHESHTLVLILVLMALTAMAGIAALTRARA